LPALRSLVRSSLALFAPIVVFAQLPTPGLTTIGTTDSIFSQTLKEQRRYVVYTPPGYQQSVYLPRSYPVVYLLDGGAHFHSFTGLLQFLSTGINGTFVVPEMIVVGVLNTDRARDLTPTESTKGSDGKPLPPGMVTSKTGGGANFLRFLRNELIPHIDSTYRTDPYRLLVGHSLGGITAVQALYTMPETFNGYIAIDPSMWWDERVLVRQAREFFAKPSLPNRSLFVAQANTVNLAPMPEDTPCHDPNRLKLCKDSTDVRHFVSIAEFNSAVNASNKSGIRYAYRYYPNDDHGSVPLIAEWDGLRFIFDGFKVDIRNPDSTMIKAHFARVSKALGYSVLPPEKLLERLSGYLPPDSAAKAIGLLRFSSRLYPKSPRVFASLGDVLLAQHDTAAARSAFEQSIAMNPKDQRIKDLLGKLTAAKK
jgi:predicted alpha/beta superfamily hydrolase